MVKINFKPVLYREDDPILMWKFRGLDSYLRVSQEQLEIENFYANPSKGVNFVFRFNFVTVQSDSLLFFIGQTVVSILQSYSSCWEIFMIAV